MLQTTVLLSVADHDHHCLLCQCEIECGFQHCTDCYLELVYGVDGNAGDFDLVTDDGADEEPVSCSYCGSDHDLWDCPHYVPCPGEYEDYEAEQLLDDELPLGVPCPAYSSFVPF